jgi:hypothetical protein
VISGDFLVLIWAPGPIITPLEPLPVGQSIRPRSTAFEHCKQRNEGSLRKSFRHRDSVDSNSGLGDFAVDLASKESASRKS